MEIGVYRWPAYHRQEWCAYAILCDDGSIYKGHTNDIKRRYNEHCEGIGALHTKRHRPVKLIYVEKFDSVEGALEKERWLKSGIGREFLRKLVNDGPACRRQVKSEVRVSVNARDFDLEQIFECGQCFRWNREDDGSYTGTAFGKIVNMRTPPAKPPAEEPRGGTGGTNSSAVLVVDNCTAEEFEQIWRPYLDLDRDYGRVKRALKGEEIARATEVGSGIRILRQDFWEALVSFIISQNNNIPRIKGCIEALAAGFGEKIGSYRGQEFYALPEPEVLASLVPEDLEAVRLGYRAPYLVETARRVCELGGAAAAREYVLGGGEACLRETVGGRQAEPGCHADDLCGSLAEPTGRLDAWHGSCDSIQAPERPAARPAPGAAQTTTGAADVIARLRTFQGVGPKVAACTALFGLGQLDAFPIDVWVRRVMHQVYGFDERDAAGMQAFARENFGEYGGIAQQYLFYYIRETSSK